MLRIAGYLAAGIVIIHGLIHLLGVVAYFPLGEVAGLPYKTTLLDGRWDIGESGMRYFSAFWLAAAVGLMASAIGLALKQDWWLPMMTIIVLLSLIITILDWSNAWRGAVLDLIILIPLLLAWGLRMQPQPFAAYPEPSRMETAVAIPPDLPDPVARYYQAITATSLSTSMGEAVPVVETAVITGRGTLRFMGITFPARLRFTHDAGQGYRHYIEATLFGLPILKVNEHYLDGQARMQLPVGVIENEPKVDMAANLSLWGESIWLPSIYLTDPRVRWEAIDDTSARLIIPFETDEEPFTVFFDPETGLITRLEALRYRDAADTEKILWQLDVLTWETYQDTLLPSRSSVTWADEGIPWLVIELDEVVYNVDVSETIRAEGP